MTTNPRFHLLSLEQGFKNNETMKSYQRPSGADDNIVMNFKRTNIQIFKNFGLGFCDIHGVVVAFKT